MEGSESAAAAAEAAEGLGLSPQLFLNEVLNSVDDVVHGAFHFCLLQAPEIVGPASATEKAEDLERGVNSIHHLVKVVLDMRMNSWEKYCLRHCFTLPEGFTVPKDDYSSDKELHKEGHSDSELDAELNSLRTNLANAYRESEDLQKEISSLERETTLRRNFDSSLTDVLRLFEENSVQETSQDIMKAIPMLHQKLLGMKRKRVEMESVVAQMVGNINGLGECKQAVLNNGITASIEDIQEVVNVSRKEQL